MTTHFENENGLLERIATLGPARLRTTIARLDVEAEQLQALQGEDYVDEKADQRAALAAEADRRGSYNSSTRIDLEDADYQIVLRGERWRAYKGVEGLTVPDVAKAANEDEAWEALIWSVRRDPLTRP